MSADDGPGTREVAHRLFAAEFEDANYEYSESDEERAPNYVVTPTGARVNRLFVVGVLTEVETVNENTLRGRVVDPTGAFVTYAGQYQPDEVAFLDRTNPPAFVGLTGKARTFQPEDSDIVYTSVRPERLSEVDADTRDRWTVSAARATLRRVAVARDAMALPERGEELRERLESAGVDPALASGVSHALAHYDTGVRYLEAVRQLAVQALEVVAGERDEVEALTVDPDEAGEVSVGPFPADIAGLETDGPQDHSGEGVTGQSTTGGTEASGEDSATASDGRATTDESLEADSGAPVETAESATADADDDSLGASSESVQSEPGDIGTEPTDAGVETGEAGVETVEAGVETGEAGVEAEDISPETTDSRVERTDTGGERIDTETTLDAEPENPTATEEPGGFDDATDTGADDDLGSFDAGGFSDTGETGEPPETADSFDPDEEEALTEEERAEIESEYDVGFSSGSEVPDPEESDLDAPDPEEIMPDPDGDEAAGESAASQEPTESGGAGDGGESDVDLSTAVVEIMGELDSGDGADREEVLAAAIDRHGADPEAVEDAIQEALMGGQCYEASDGLKPI